MRPPAGARFARDGELRRFQRGSAPLVDQAWFPLGYAGRRGMPARLPEEDLARHVLVVGLTGAHKTTAVTFPVLLAAARVGVSVVALDLKYGEDDSLVLAAPEWARCGRDVLIFAPLDPVSLRWNPLAECRSMGGAHRLAAMLFDDVESGDPDLVYWMGVERHLCAALCFAVATDGGPPTLQRLRHLCEGGPAVVHAYVQSHKATGDFEARLGSYRAMLPKDEAGILQGIASRLEAWGDEDVCRATGIGRPEDTVNLDRLRREPVLLIVGLPQPALGRLRWLCHLFLRDLAARLLRPRRPDERMRVLQVLEELPAWGRLPGFADHLATFRSRRVSVLATIQSEAQGEYVYGREGWAAIAANLGTKIYFPWLADLDAERLSRALGTAVGEDVSHSRGWGAGGRRGGELHRMIQIPLRRPEELQGIDSPEDEILVRCPRLPPARLWCPPFYVRSECRGRVPDAPPSTSELVVYHHLRQRHGAGSNLPVLPPDSRPAPAAAGAPLLEVESGDRDTRPEVSEAPVAETAPLHQAEPASDEIRPEVCPVSVPESAPGPTLRTRPQQPRDGQEGGASPEEIAALSQFIQRLAAAPVNPDRAPLRPVRRGGRLVEVRVDPRIALALFSDPQAAHSLLRRWAELRWVRQVRPAFVLERRAIEAVGPVLMEQLTAICENTASVGPK